MPTLERRRSVLMRDGAWHLKRCGEKRHIRASTNSDSRRKTPDASLILTAPRRHHEICLHAQWQAVRQTAGKRNKTRNLKLPFPENGSATRRRHDDETLQTSKNFKTGCAQKRNHLRASKATTLHAESKAFPDSAAASNVGGTGLAFIVR